MAQLIDDNLHYTPNPLYSKKAVTGAARLLTILHRKEHACDHLSKWREGLVNAIAIMDTKSGSIQGATSRALFNHDWDAVRTSILTIADSIREQMDSIEEVSGRNDE